VYEIALNNLAPYTATQSVSTHVHCYSSRRIQKSKY